MLQKHILTFILAILTLQIFGQTLIVRSESGVKGGALYTGLKNNNDSIMSVYETKNGFTIGGFYRINQFLGPLNFQAEILYQLKGKAQHYKYGYGSGYGYGYPYGYNSYGGYGYPSYSYNYASNYASEAKSRNTENYHYITIPLLVSATVFNFVDIYVGPEFGYMFAEPNNQNSTAGINKLSIGMATGIGLQLGENTKVDFRYSTDFTQLYNIEQYHAKNQSFAFTVQQTLFRRLK